MFFVVYLNKTLQMKKGQKSRHHIYPRSRHKELKQHYSHLELETTLKIYHERHIMWHKLFGNLHIGEVIDLLIRVERITKRKGGKRC